MSKIIKDSVHGYIEIEDKFVSIINSAEFQRLKNIEQGSYRVLYPSARHDRFIHSLGVHHLAKLFSISFIKNIHDDLGIEEEYNVEVQTFCYASLLHDIGHAPFSHTTEDFFKIATSDGDTAINVSLCKSVDEYIDSLNISPDIKTKRKEAFRNDFDCGDCNPKPHEIISATLLILLAKDFITSSEITNYDLELAARMVIGCTYSIVDLEGDEQTATGIRNCFIRLLNSDTVDVDKIDYIKRDNLMTGFENVSIDINRLARSVTAVKTDDGIYPAFRKSALSVIDNVFRAKEEQGNWIISHPIVLYDSGILSTAISQLWNSEDLQKVFSICSLGRKNTTGLAESFTLLNDSDIIPLLKKKADFDNRNIYAQIFDRNIRLKPIWKSKDEYHVFFDGKEERVFGYFKGVIEYLKLHDFILNGDSYNKLQTGAYDDNVKKVAKSLKDFADNNGIMFNFAFTEPKSSFAPSFDSERVYIRFNKRICKEEYVSFHTLHEDEKEKSFKYFYLYSEAFFSEDLLIKFKDDVLAKSRPRA